MVILCVPHQTKPGLVGTKKTCRSEIEDLNFYHHGYSSDVFIAT